MPLKKSDNLEGGWATLGEPGSPWLATLRSNWLWPLLLILLLPLGRIVEDPARVSGFWSHVIILIGINITAALGLQLINGISGQFSLGHAGFMAIGAYVAAVATTSYSAVPDDPSTPYANPGLVLLFCFAVALVMALVAGVVYILYRLVRASARVHTALPLLVTVLLLASLLVDVSMARDYDTPPSYFLWSQGLAGVARLFAAVTTSGANAATELSLKVPQGLRQPCCFLIALLGAGTFAGFAGLLVGLPTLRLRGDYLAIATLGFGEIILVALTNADCLGGSRGLVVPPYANGPDPDNAVAGHYVLPWIYGAAVLAFVCVWRLAHSPKGRTIRAVREDEIAAAAVGINTTAQKVLTFIVGAFLGGVAGALLAHVNNYINPMDFDFDRSLELVVMVTLAGLGSLWGTVLATAFVTGFPEILRELAPHLPPLLRHLAEARMVIYSVLLVGIMLLRARGFDFLRRRTGSGPYGAAANQ